MTKGDIDGAGAQHETYTYLVGRAYSWHCLDCGAQAGRGFRRRMDADDSANEHANDPPTLAEFLLARIDMDEYWARTVMRQFAHTPAVAPPMEPARVLADCDAKRRIVNMHAPVGRELRVLASTYADHSDYRPEWRP